MTNLAAFLLLALTAPLPFQSSGDTLDVRVTDGRVSVHAEAVPLDRLLESLDQAAGTRSTVPPELGNRNVNVQFSGLELDKAIKKIFEGVPLDYAVVERKQIVVTAASKNVTGQPRAAAHAVPTATPPAPGSQPSAGRQPPPAATANPFQPAPGAAPAPAADGDANASQPAVIQTPFGPIVNPRLLPNGQAPANGQPTSPMVMPGGQGTLPFGTTPPQSGVPFLPGSPATQPGSQPNVFGNTSPQMLDLDKQNANPPANRQP